MQNFVQNVVLNLKKYKQQVIIGTLISGTGIIIYLTFFQNNSTQISLEVKKNDSQNSQDQELEIEQNIEISPKNDSAQNLVQSGFEEQQDTSNISEIAHKIVIQYIDDKSQILDLGTISKVLEFSVDIIQQQFQQLTEQSRIQRRLLMKTQGFSDEYLQNIINYNEQVEKMLTNAQETILFKINIQKEIFEESIIEMMERGLYQQIYMLQVAVRQKIKEKLNPIQRVQIDQIKEILKYQIKLLRDQPGLFQSVIEKPSSSQNQQLIPILLNTIINDMIFQKYKIEEEDFLRNIQEFSNNQMIIQLGKQDNIINELIQQLHEQMIELMAKYGYGIGGGLSDDMASLKSNPI